MDALAKLSRAKLDAAAADWTLSEIRKTAQPAVAECRHDVASKLLTSAVNWARRTRSWATLRELE